MYLTFVNQERRFRNFLRLIEKKRNASGGLRRLESRKATRDGQGKGARRESRRLADEEG